MFDELADAKRKIKDLEHKMKGKDEEIEKLRKKNGNRKVWCGKI